MFRNERDVLLRLRGPQFSRVITLLASYEWRGDYYIMLPIANCSLRQFWSQTDSTSNYTLWMSWTVGQIAELADCLANIHDFGRNVLPSDELQNADAVGAIHGDIKPQNILIMKSTAEVTAGNLVFADFGISHVFSKSSPGDPAPFYGNRSFEAPENRTVRDVGRPSDMWSFGCVIFEFLVWLVLGRDSLQAFRKDRFMATPGCKYPIKDDVFYSLVYNSSARVQGVIVRPTVGQYAARIYQDSKCVGPVRKITTLVLSGLLVAEPTRRLTADEIAQKIKS